MVAAAQLADAPRVVSESDSLLFASCGRRPSPPGGVIVFCTQHRSTTAQRTARSSLQGVISCQLTFLHPSSLTPHLSPSPFAFHPSSLTLRTSPLALLPSPSPTPFALDPFLCFYQRARWLH